MISIYLLLDCEGGFQKPTWISFSHNDGFFRKPTWISLVLMSFFFENPPVLPYP